MLSARNREKAGAALAARARRRAWEVVRSTIRHAPLAAGASLLCLTASSVAVAQQRPLGPGTVMQAVEGLKQGEYLWAPEMSPDGPVLVLVSLATQRAIAYRNGIPIGVSTVSSGKEGYQTPTGVFTILQKHTVHKSNLYGDAPMPYMQRLTWDGIALHAGSIPGFPASHGCVRLPLGFAKLLYGVTKLGLTVVITNESAVPRLAPTPDLLTPGSTAVTNSGSAKASGWHPERSPIGPVSIIVSAADRRIVVLRNGVEIGAAGIEIDGKVTGTSAYALRSVDATGTHWVQLPLPGQAAADVEVAAEQRKRFRVPDPFRKAIAAILKPGMTVVLTSDSLISAATGSKLTVIVGEDDVRPR
jgi:L,D-transpeptidase catalytic domain